MEIIRHLPILRKMMGCILLLQSRSFVKRLQKPSLRLAIILFAVFTSFLGVTAQNDGSANVTVDGIKYHVYPTTAFNQEWAAYVDGYEPGIVTANIPTTVSAEVTYYDGRDSQGQPIYTTRVVPATVRTIEWEAFKDCTTLKNVVIGDSVTYIHYGAFSGCTAMETLTIGVSVESGNWYSFLYCSPREITYLAKNGEFLFDGMSFENIEKVTIGPEVEHFSFYGYENYCHPRELIWNARHCTSIGDIYAWDIDTVTIGDGVEYLPDEFLRRGDKITSITIPSSVREIGVDAFAGCKNLARVDISDLSAWCRINFNGTQAGPPQELRDYWDDDYDDAYHSWCQSNPCCYGANLYLNDKIVKSLTIPSGITAVNDGAFSGCGSLTGVTIGNQVTSVGACSFDNCANLKGTSIGDGVTSIGAYAFAESPVNTVTIGTGVTNIGRGAFLFSGSSGGGEEKSALNAGNTISRRYVQISDLAKWCQIDFEDINSNPLYVQVKDSYGYDDYYNYDKYYYSSVLRRRQSGKVYTTLKDLDGVQHINKYAFAMCGSLESIDSQNPFISIGDYAFYHCIKLASVDIPGTVTSIGDFAFCDCHSLTDLTLPNSITHIGKHAFDLRRYYPGDEKHGPTTLTIPDAITSISDFAFAGWTNLEKITIPETVTYIAEGAFYEPADSVEVTCYATTPPELSGYTSFYYYYKYRTYTLRVPRASVGIYQSTRYWMDFGTIVAIEDEEPNNPADLNGDGEVNIADVNALIDIILEGHGGQGGDVNGDGEVNIADVNALINIILSPGS